MNTVGGYLEYRGGVQYRGGYHVKCGGYLEYRGVFSTVGDIMSTVGVILSTVGVILSTVGDVQYCGGYHEYRGGCSIPWGENLLLFEYPTVLNTPTVLMISPHMYYDIPTVLKFHRMVSPHSTEHPHGTHDIPRAS